MRAPAQAVTVGVDVGTTSVKALAVDEDGTGRRPQPGAPQRGGARARHPAPRRQAGLARRARARPSQQVTAAAEAEGHRLAGVAVASMVPSLTAVSSRGVPLLPGLLYGDREGRPDAARPVTTPSCPPGTMPDAEGFLRWAAAAAPDARGYWPCQAVATYALSGLPAIDTGVTAALGLAPHPRALERRAARLPRRLASRRCRWSCRWARPPATLPGSDAVITGGTIDALCDQIVAGATEPGRRAGDLRGDPHRVGGVRGVAGGARADQLPAHDARAVPHRRAEQRRRAVRRLGPAAPARHAAARARARAARAAARRTGPGPGLAALRPGRAHALRGPHPALEPLRARHRVGRRGARAGRLRGQRLRRPAHARPRGCEGHAHRGQRRRLARHGLDGRGGRRHQPPRRHRRRPRGGGPRRGVLRPPGRRARDVARRLGPLGRGGPQDRARPGLGARRRGRATRRFSELGHRAA